MNYYIYFESGNANYTYKYIASKCIFVSEDVVKLRGGEASVLNILKNKYNTTEKIVSMFMPDCEDVTYTEIVSCVEGKWIQGEYFTHEYDVYVLGRGRKLSYSNGYTEYQIECLNKSIEVADGIWDEAGCTRVYNGCGDYFVPYESGML